MIRKLLFLLIFILAAGIFVLTYFHKFPKASQNTPAIPQNFSIFFNQALTRSNLYPPSNIKIEAVSKSSIEFSWSFYKKKLIETKGLAPEYSILSGFRVYRDGFWFEDVPKDVNHIIDTNLYPGQTYSYNISALTFDNKIEGASSSAVTVNVPNFPLNPIIPYTNNNFSVYLAEGDSITLGAGAGKGFAWADQVANFLQAKNVNLSYINEGIDGAISSDIDSRIGSDIQQYNPDLITIAVGVNDLYYASSYLGNVSIWEYKNNLRKILTIAHPSGSRKIILLNIFYLNGEKNKEKAWNKVVYEVGNEFGVKVVDVYDSMKENGGNSLLTGILHPNQYGHNLIAKDVINVLKFK